MQNFADIVYGFLDFQFLLNNTALKALSETAKYKNKTSFKDGLANNRA